jgi:hypothetical protein
MVEMIPLGAGLGLEELYKVNILALVYEGSLFIGEGPYRSRNKAITDDDNGHDQAVG